jgi:hypothetical protein
VEDVPPPAEAAAMVAAVLASLHQMGGERARCSGWLAGCAGRLAGWPCVPAGDGGGWKVPPGDSPALLPHPHPTPPHPAAAANMAKALLSAPAHGLAGYAAGRAAIREGAVRWYGTHPAGAAAAADDDKSRHHADALRWAAQALADAAAQALAKGEQVGPPACFFIRGESWGRGVRGGGVRGCE